MKNNLFVSAHVRDLNTIDVKLKKRLSLSRAEEIAIMPHLAIHAVSLVDHQLELAVEPIDIAKTYRIKLENDVIVVDVDALLDGFYSDKELGCTWDATQTTFRLFAPRAKGVQLWLFANVTDEPQDPFDLRRDRDGVWEISLPGHYFGACYAYSVDGPSARRDNFDSKLFADPYSRAVATTNDYLHRGKTLILDTSHYDWQGDTPLALPNEDLIIYECHVRDLTAHPSSGVRSPLAGSYKGLIQRGQIGGIEHIKVLGVNAVEFLPIHDFGNIEIPYGEPVGGIVNTWNPYARNHWGYMTSYFFAPESYYADGALAANHYSGVEGRQVNDFKDVVKAFHREGIAVILDVVYNHVSQYDQNCFKCIDEKYYFHLHDDGTLRSDSGCGNDFKTDRPMARKLIIDSVKFWLQEYHVDGFRFDLATMIDWQTCDEIMREARKVNPNVILIAEPWGGGVYNPVEFSRHGWAAWNDQIRNGVKGQNPFDKQGFIFGQWYDHNNPERMKSYVLGTLAEDGGLFQKKSHSINYLESHDDHTLGDFIRIGLGGSQRVDDVDENARLTTAQLQLNKLAALFLFTSQGAIMIHEGQEWARSKVIAPTPAPDKEIGHIDHNSYNKDNQTNWLNFAHAARNADLLDYYRGLIALRKAHPAFRRAVKLDFEFFTVQDNPFAVVYKIDRFGSGDSHDFIVAINGNRRDEAEIELPPGDWQVVVDGQVAGARVIRTARKSVTIPPSTGMVLRN
ncbi:pullulanase [candidate division KSB1 bacterium]|nr:pullulanase [candidate division KSB1 bacterium]